MTIDQTIVVWCVIVPGLIAGAASVVARRLRPRFRSLAVAIGWWCAVVTALAGFYDWQWWPDESWRQTIWPLLAWAILMSGTSDEREVQFRLLGLSMSESGRWVLGGMLACVTAVVAIPSGDQWSDTFHLHRVWVAAVATSCLLNSYWIERMARAGAERWSLLVALAALGGPMALAASCYGSLAQWTMAAIVATLVMALFAAMANSSDGSAAALGVLAFAASITAAGRFHTYVEHPGWVYALMLYGPTLVAVIDALIRGRATWLRVTNSAVVCSVIVGTCAGYVLLG